MPHWLIKSAIHRTLSYLPGSHWWNEQLQKKISRSLDLTSGRFELRLRDTKRHLDQLFEFGPENLSQFSVFELGTGWYPVVPVALYLCGAAGVWTVDIVSHLNPERIKRTFDFFLEYDRNGMLGKFLPRLRPERLVKLKDTLAQPSDKNGGSVLEALNIHALVRDAQNTGIAPASINLFVSNGVMEYIPRPVLSNMLAEFKRIARPGAVLSNFIVLADEYAQFDHSITRFNFLKYSDSQWKFLDSPFTSKSRLRISDYRELFTQAGCDILDEKHEKGDIRDLEKIRLAPQFEKYSKADLLVLTAWITSRFRSALVS